MKQQFKRENRYIVLKIKDLEQLNPVLLEELTSTLSAIENLTTLPKREFVVIESDWPEYEPVWEMIERRVNNLTEAQPAREWVGLTEKEREDLFFETSGNNSLVVIDCTESKLREKNAVQPAADDKAGGEVVEDPFLQGICVALQHVKQSDEVCWRAIVESVGVDQMLNYVTFIEPEEWELAGFSKLAEQELHRRRPRKPRYTRPQPQAEARVPEGYALVPVEPTEEMMMEGMKTYNNIERAGMPEYDFNDCIELTYKAMLATAPQPQADA